MKDDANGAILALHKSAEMLFSTSLSLLNTRRYFNKLHFTFEQMKLEQKQQQKQYHLWRWQRQHWHEGEKKNSFLIFISCMPFSFEAVNVLTVTSHSWHNTFAHTASYHRCYCHKLFTLFLLLTCIIFAKMLPVNLFSSHIFSLLLSFAGDEEKCMWRFFFTFCTQTRCSVQIIDAKKNSNYYTGFSLSCALVWCAHFFLL